MEELLAYIQANVSYAPWLIFGLLLLAGFNIPVSEDAMLFVAAVLAAKNPPMLWPLFMGVFSGAYLSDVICYWMGRLVGPRLRGIKFFANMAPQDRVDKIGRYYAKYGIFTLILGRFIPFGVRNGLFLTAGLGKMNFLHFALSDLVAATISCSLYFYLYFVFGETVIEWVKKANYFIFALAVIVAAILLFKKKMTKQVKRVGQEN